MDHVWTCGCCGQGFTGLPLDHAYTSPDPWFALPEAERARRGKIDTDVCRLDDNVFVRGCLEIPILDAQDKFVWGVWVSLSEGSFARILDLWSTDVPDDEPPLFGWLCNSIWLYPETYALKTHVRLRGGRMRPAIELEPTDHPLALEQRNGITLRRVEEIVAASRPHGA